MTKQSQPQHSSLPHALRPMHITLLPSFLSLPPTTLLFQEQDMSFNCPCISAILRFLDCSKPFPVKRASIGIHGKQVDVHTYQLDRTSASTAVYEREAVEGFGNSLLGPLRLSGRRLFVI